MFWVPGEVLRNIGSGTTRALRYVFVFSVILCCATLADIISVNTLIVRAHDYRDSGSAIITIEAQGLVDGKACDSFAQLSAVRAAGAISQYDDSLVSAALPDGAVSAYRITPGAASLFQVVDEKEVPGVFVSRDVLETLGVSAGGFFETKQNHIPIRGSFSWPQDGRKLGYSYAALSIDTSTSAFDECWVDAWPVVANLETLIYLVLNPDPTGQTRVNVSQVNTTKGQIFNGATMYAERVTQYAPFFTVFAGIFIGYVAIWSRRLEFAAGQHLGVTRREQLLQTFLETILWVGAAGLASFTTVIIFIVSINQTDRLMLTHLAAHIIIPGLIGVVLGSLLSSALIRESQLFTYFKNR